MVFRPTAHVADGRLDADPGAGGGGGRARPRRRHAAAGQHRRPAGGRRGVAAREPLPRRGRGGLADRRRHRRSGYNQNCARCHGLGAVSGGLAPDLRFLEADEFGDEWFVERFRTGYTQDGTTKMPAFGELLGQKAAWAIRTYVETRPDDGALDEYGGQLEELRDQIAAWSETAPGRRGGRGGAHRAHRDRRDGGDRLGRAGGRQRPAARRPADRRHAGELQGGGRGPDREPFRRAVAQ